MTTEETKDRLGRRVMQGLRLGAGRGPAKLNLVNPEWAEADRLGRLLLANFDAQDERRRGTTTDGGNEDGV